MIGVEALAYAKINLFLEVVRRRSDGYHDLVSVFQEIPLADRLSAEPAEHEISLACSNPFLPTDDRNLVVRAARLLREEAGISQGIHFVLEKHIPAGGGLGGGSSDAAAALRLACRIWNLTPPPEDLARLALALGSDVPFFLQGGTCLAEGRGEILTPLRGAPRLEPILLLPPWSISTARAYAALSPTTLGTRSISSFLRALERGDLFAMAEESFNRFEDVVFLFEPREKKLYDAVASCHPLALRMSGSGSALWCLPGDKQVYDRIVAGTAELSQSLGPIHLWQANTPPIQAQGKRGSAPG